MLRNEREQIGSSRPVPISSRSHPRIPPRGYSMPRFAPVVLTGQKKSTRNGVLSYEAILQDYSSSALSSSARIDRETFFFSSLMSMILASTSWPMVRASSAFAMR